MYNRTEQQRTKTEKRERVEQRGGLQGRKDGRTPPLTPKTQEAFCVIV